VRSMMRRILIWPAGACLLFCMGTSFANTTTFQTNDKGSGQDLDIGSRTVLGITLGQSNLTDVRRKFGPSAVWSSGDASTAADSVCFVSQDANPAAIGFASNAEMAGPPENIVTDVTIVARKAYPESSCCRSVTISPSAIATTTGLRLGLSLNRIRNLRNSCGPGTSARWSER
jgi:hypothetical protein